MKTEKKFAVAAKAVIFNHKNQVLTIKKSKRDNINPEQLDIPGGRLEFGEDLIQTLKRSIREESGLEITIVAPSRTWTLIKDNLQIVGVTFAVKCIDGGDVRLSGEHDSYKWTDINKIENEKLPNWIVSEIVSAMEVMVANQYAEAEIHR